MGTTFKMVELVEDKELGHMAKTTIDRMKRRGEWPANDSPTSS